MKIVIRKDGGNVSIVGPPKDDGAQPCMPTNYHLLLVLQILIVLLSSLQWHWRQKTSQGNVTVTAAALHSNIPNCHETKVHAEGCIRWRVSVRAHSAKCGSRYCRRQTRYRQYWSSTYYSRRQPNPDGGRFYSAAILTVLMGPRRSITAFGQRFCEKQISGSASPDEEAKVGRT